MPLDRVRPAVICEYLINGSINQGRESDPQGFQGLSHLSRKSATSATGTLSHQNHRGTAPHDPTTQVTTRKARAMTRSPIRFESTARRGRAVTRMPTRPKSTARKDRAMARIPDPTLIDGPQGSGDVPQPTRP